MKVLRAVAMVGVALVVSVHARSALAQVAGAGPGGQRGDPGVSVRKSGGGTYTAGQAATFTLGVTNAASSNAMSAGVGLTVIDTLPPNFVAPITASGSAPGAWQCSVAGHVVTCHYSGAPVSPGANFPVITVTATAREAGRFSNCATAKLEKVKESNTRDNRSCVQGEITPGGGTGGESKFDVGVRKSGPGSLVSGQTGTWTLSTINTGPSTVNSGSGVVVIDTLPANLTAPITASGAPGWACTVSGQVVTCTYVGSPVGPGRPMPPITVTAVGGRVDGGRNCAWIVVKEGADSRPGDNSSCVEVVVTRPSDGGGTYDVSMRKRGPDAVVTGQTATFTLSPHNNGPSSVNNASGVVVTDTLPAANFTAPITASGGVNWNCAVVGAVVTCTYTGTALVGPGPLPQITITAIARREGNAQNCASIVLTRAGRDARPEDNRDCITVVIRPGTSESMIFDLSMRKRGPDSVSAGQTATFALSPHNNGPTSVNNATGIIVTDTVPAFFTAPITANGAPNWNCTVVGLAVTCTYTGATLIGPGPLSPISVSAVAGQSGAGRNCAAINLTGGTDANTGDNRDCTSVVVRRPPAPAPLTIAKTILDDCYTNNNGNDTQCTFRFTITNGGGTPWTGPLVVSDLATPAASLALVGGQPAGWSCAGASPMVCTSSGPVTIPAFGSVSFNLTLTVTSPVIVTQNCATLTSVPATAVAPSPSSCVPIGRTSATGGATLTVVKIAQPQSTQAFHFVTQGTGLTPFDLDNDGNNSNALSNTKTFTNLATGIPHTVNLVPGANMTCTVTNVETGWPNTNAILCHPRDDHRSLADEVGQSTGRTVRLHHGIYFIETPSESPAGHQGTRICDPDTDPG